MTDTIFITGVVIHARHGVMEHETEVGQRFVIDLELFTDLSESSHTDRLADTVSYSNVVATATAAFQAFALAVVAFPVAAWVSNHVKNLSGRGFARALIVMEAGELPVLLGLVLGFLAIDALPMP